MVRRLEGWRMTLHGDVDDSGADAAKHNKKLIDAVNMKLLKLCGKSEIRTGILISENCPQMFTSIIIQKKTLSSFEFLKPC